MMILPIAFALTTALFGQVDPTERSSSHYAPDSLFFTVDTVRFEVPLSTAQPRIEKAMTRAAGQWSKNGVKSIGGSMAAGTMEFTYMPDNLMEVSRAGYLSTFAIFNCTDGMCVIRLAQWEQRPATTFLEPDLSFGPIARGGRCSQNLCSALGVAKCSEACNAELWPALQKVRSEVLGEVRAALAGK